MSQVLPKNFGKSLIYHKNLMRNEYKKNIQRLKFLAEERHVQYRKEFIDFTRQKIEQNQINVLKESNKIRELVNKSKNQKALLDMGFDKIKQQLAAEKKQRQEKVRIQFDKMKALEVKARREWITELNDKCSLWNRSPDELQFAQYRLLNKKIFERLPKERNFVLDRSENPESNVDAFESSSSIDGGGGYKGKLRSNQQQLAFLLANGTKLPIDRVEDLDMISDETLKEITLDKNSQDYIDYQEYLKFQNQNSEKLKNAQKERIQLSEISLRKQQLETGIADMNLELADPSNVQNQFQVSIEHEDGRESDFNFDFENLTEDLFDNDDQDHDQDIQALVQQHDQLMSENMPLASKEALIDEISDLVDRHTVIREDINDIKSADDVVDNDDYQQLDENDLEKENLENPFDFELQEDIVLDFSKKGEDNNNNNNNNNPNEEK